MMDIKHTDPAKHRAATGVSNKRILANARQLAQTGKPLIFRLPIVPAVNDTPAEVEAIAALVRQLAALRPAGAEPPSLELLPFHRLAADKYHSLGLDYRAANAPHGAEFYDGLEAVVLGIQGWIRRHAAAAQRLAAAEVTPQLRANLLEIAEINARLANEAPRTFRKACQWML